MPERPDRPSPARAALQTTLIYLLGASSWILLSDWLLSLGDPLPQTLHLWQVLKGLGFVSITSLLLFVLLRTHLQRQQESRRRFATLVENLPGVTYRCENDPSWTMRYISRASQQVTGYAPSELIGNACVAYGDLIEPEDRAPVWRQVQQALDADRPFQVEYRLRRRDGRLIWIWEQGRGVPDGERDGQRVMEGMMLDITERKQAEALAQETAERLQNLGDNLPGGAIYQLHRSSNGEYRFTYASKGVEQVLGISRAQMLQDSQAVFGLTEPPHGQMVYTTNERSARELTIVDMELPQRLPDGSRKWIAVRSMPYKAQDGGVFWDGVVLDISERRAAEEKLRQAATVFECSVEGIVITDADGTIVSINPAFQRITGYAAQEAIGQNPRILKSGRHTDQFYQSLWAKLLQSGSWQGEIWNRRKDGELLPEWLTISAVYDADGKVSNYIGVFTDLTALKTTEAELERLSHYDPVTGLANRVLFGLRLEHAIDLADGSGRRLGVIFLGIDRFKTINESLGHPAGDQLLKEVATRLRAQIRQRDLVARLGGDEYAVLLEGVAGTSDCARWAERLRESIARPLWIEGRQTLVAASAGIAVFPTDANDRIGLMRSADAALSQAKAHGRNGYRFYDPSQTEQAIARLDLLHELGIGIEQGQLELWFQPQVNLVSGRPVSVEALVRWRHPQRGLIYPNTFIPLAEESGLIVELGEWVLQESCRALAAWRKRGLELERIAINLSSAQLDQPDLVSRVEQVLRDFGTTASMLELELTESFLMRDMERARGVTERLSALGVNLAVDDFGTGYSSLAHLKRLSVDRLKIDKGFVSDLPQGLEAAAIVRAVIALAHNLRQEVIAEGVETEAQLDFLARQGCDAIQGYLYSRPLPANALEQLLASDLRLPAAVT